MMYSGLGAGGGAHAMPPAELQQPSPVRRWDQPQQLYQQQQQQQYPSQYQQQYQHSYSKSLQPPSSQAPQLNQAPEWEWNKVPPAAGPSQGYSNLDKSPAWAPVQYQVPSAPSYAHTTAPAADRPTPPPPPPALDHPQSFVPQPAYTTSKGRRQSRPSLGNVGWQGPPPPGGPPRPVHNPNPANLYHQQSMPQMAIPFGAPSNGPFVDGHPPRLDSLRQSQSTPALFNQQYPGGGAPGGGLQLGQTRQYQLGNDDGHSSTTDVLNGWASSLINTVDYYGNKLVDSLGLSNGQVNSTSQWDRNRYQPNLSQQQRVTSSPSLYAPSRGGLYQPYDASSLV
ncbi:hypothetical protein DFS34DRAFT_693966 [Phlyctochytrium arcticum]|nr:hypothetical protein DFS34DRAFT_693966 [Phlyctochytrium arcticum]